VQQTEFLPQKSGDKVLYFKRWGPCSRVPHTTHRWFNKKFPTENLLKRFERFVPMTNDKVCKWVSMHFCLEAGIRKIYKYRLTEWSK
jgi:hypothetical protein